MVAFRLTIQCCGSKGNDLRNPRHAKIDWGSYKPWVVYPGPGSNIVGPIPMCFHLSRFSPPFPACSSVDSVACSMVSACRHPPTSKGATSKRFVDHRSEGMGFCLPGNSGATEADHLGVGQAGGNAIMGLELVGARRHDEKRGWCEGRETTAGDTGPRGCSVRLASEESDFDLGHLHVPHGLKSGENVDSASLRFRLDDEDRRFWGEEVFISDPHHAKRGPGQGTYVATDVPLVTHARVLQGPDPFKCPISQRSSLSSWCGPSHHGLRTLLRFYVCFDSPLVMVC